MSNIVIGSLKDVLLLHKVEKMSIKAKENPHHSILDVKNILLLVMLQFRTREGSFFYYLKRTFCDIKQHKRLTKKL